jgi:hypothetical protein
LFLTDILDKETLVSRKIVLDEEIESAMQSVGDLQEKISHINDMPDSIEDISELREIVEISWDVGFTTEEKRLIINQLGVRIELERAGDVSFVHIYAVIGNGCRECNALRCFPV